MKLLSFLDLAIIALYLIGITWIGTRFYQRDANLKEYLLGSNVMKWFPVALSILATDTSAITYLGSPAWAFQHNMKLSLGMLACFFAVPIVIWLFLPVYSKGNLYTAYQYLEQRFDSRVRVIASICFLLVRGSHVAVVIYVPALVMSELMGVPLKFSVLAIGVLTAVYTSLGGIKAVIWTDALQVGMVFLGFGLLAASALNNIPGGLHEVWAVGRAHGKFDLFDFSFNWDKIDNFWALMLGGTLLFVQGMSTDQAVLQKYFTTRSKSETSKALLFYIAAVMLLVILLSFLGIILFVCYSHHPELRATLRNPDAVVPHYAAKMLPHGLTGVVIASILAGAMSTVSASINALSTSTVVDIYQRLIQREQSEQHYVRASRCATLIWGAVATIGALYAYRLGTLVVAFTKIQGLIGGVILGIFLLGVTMKRIGGTEVIVGTVIGFATVVYFAAYTPVSIYWYSAIGCFSTVLVSCLYHQLFISKISDQERSEAEKQSVRDKHSSG